MKGINSNSNKFRRYASSKLPTIFGEFTCLVYRMPDGTEHIALQKGPLDLNSAVLCRIQSECLTSEVFGSIKCDCRQQLDLAMRRLAESGGILLYLRQEGRGIGLGDKIRAYSLQEKGLDTVDANRELGLPDDARDYDIAALMLKDLGISSVTLMTNNPTKIMGLKSAGIHVQGRVAHDIDDIPSEARAYLDIKRERMGHLLEPESQKVPAQKAIAS